MEPRFRPIPLTIVDFLAILLPGFVWLVLIVTMTQMFFPEELFNEGDNMLSPLNSFSAIVSYYDELKSPWIVVLIVIIASMLIGYALKPIAMRCAGWLARPMFIFHKKTRGLSFKELKHPYNRLHENEPYYQEVIKLLKTAIGCSLNSLPGDVPFGGAKRYLRFTAPTLWEESERREAEVRMIGALLLAAAFSWLLSLVTIVLQYVDVFPCTSEMGTWVWLGLSTLAAFVLAEGFNYTRVREVETTYINILVAASSRSDLLTMR